MLLFLLNLRKGSSQIELDQFFQHTGESEALSRAVTKSAFFQSRKQLSHHAFIDLNNELVQQLYDKAGLETWKGLRVCAVDGSWTRLPNEQVVIDEFGQHTGNKKHAGCTMGLASVYYDLLNQIVLDASLNSVHASERDCAAKHLEQANDNDLVIYDRGYNAFWLYKLHSKRELAFCMRAKVNQGLLFQRFAQSGKAQEIVTLKPNKSSIKQCKQLGLDTSPLTLRLVRVELPGEVEVLITNLLDEEAFEAECFKALYHFRWGVEESYKRLKQWVEIENFSGKSVLSVRQDFHAKILACNLTTLVALTAQKQIDKRTKNHANKYQVNFAQALSKMKHVLAILIRDSTTGITSILEKMVAYVALSFEAVRPERSYARKVSTTRNKVHYSAYKRCL